ITVDNLRLGPPAMTDPGGVEEGLQRALEDAEADIAAGLADLLAGEDLLDHRYQTADATEMLGNQQQSGDTGGSDGHQYHGAQPAVPGDHQQRQGQQRRGTEQRPTGAGEKDHEDAKGRTEELEVAALAAASHKTHQRQEAE